MFGRGGGGKWSLTFIRALAPPILIFVTSDLNDNFSWTPFYMIQPKTKFRFSVQNYDFWQALEGSDHFMTVDLEGLPWTWACPLPTYKQINQYNEQNYILKGFWSYPIFVWSFQYWSFPIKVITICMTQPYGKFADVIR